MIYTHHKFKLQIKKTITPSTKIKEKTNQTETKNENTLIIGLMLLGLIPEAFC